MKQRILITGGMGYLGGRIAAELAGRHGLVVRLGDLKLADPPAWLPGSETAAIDVMAPATLAPAMHDVRAVVHLAAVNENDSLADPERAILVNTLGTWHVLEAAMLAGVERFIYFSTAHVYGAPLAGHITEQTLPRPAHPYAMTHRAAEDFVLAAHDQHRCTGIVVRLSNGFGAPAHPHVNRWTLVVNDLCRQAVQTGKLLLRSSGLQNRDFITLADVAAGVGHLLALDREACGDGLFNLGGDHVASVWEMTQRVAGRCQAVLGFTPEIGRRDPDPGEKPADLRYDSSKIERTGFRRRSDVDAELDATLRFCMRTWGSGTANGAKGARGARDE